MYHIPVIRIEPKTLKQNLVNGIKPYLQAKSNLKKSSHNRNQTKDPQVKTCSSNVSFSISIENKLEVSKQDQVSSNIQKYNIKGISDKNIALEVGRNNNNKNDWLLQF